MNIMRILLYTLVALLLCLVVVWLAVGIWNVDKVYGKKMFGYQEDKICIECFNGTRTGTCPQLMDDKLTYPRAAESTEMMDSAPNDSSDYSDSHVIRNGFCTQFHSTLTTEGQDYIKRFQTMPIPEKSYAESLGVAWRYVGDFFVAIICRTIGCKM